MRLELEHKNAEEGTTSTVLISPDFKDLQHRDELLVQKSCIVQGKKKDHLEGFVSGTLDLVCLVSMQIPTLQAPEFGLKNPILNDI